MIAAAVFFAALLFLVYVVAGYPLLLGWMAARRARPIRRGEELLSVSVIIAVRNGEQWMRRKLLSIRALDYPRELMETLVVCDGCTDLTEIIAAEFAGRGVRVLAVPPGGKAAALRAGIAAARHEILLMTYVRPELERSCLR